MRGVVIHQSRADIYAAGSSMIHFSGVLRVRFLFLDVSFSVTLTHIRITKSGDLIMEINVAIISDLEGLLLLQKTEQISTAETL
jgi:hypothetical protein